jgi:hypothetical protein
MDSTQEGGTLVLCTTFVFQGWQVLCLHQEEWTIPTPSSLST